MSDLHRCRLNDWSRCLGTKRFNLRLLRLGYGLLQDDEAVPRPGIGRIGETRPMGVLAGWREVDHNIGFESLKRLNASHTHMVGLLLLPPVPNGVQPPRPHQLAVLEAQ